MIESRIAAYSVSRIEDAAKITFTFERDSQDAKRAKNHETQHMCLELSEAEAKQLIEKLNEELAGIAFFRQHGRWKDYRDSQA
jgi:hypothetical protein